MSLLCHPLPAATLSEHRLACFFLFFFLALLPATVMAALRVLTQLKDFAWPQELQVTFRWHSCSCPHQSSPHSQPCQLVCLHDWLYKQRWPHLAWVRLGDLPPGCDITLRWNLFWIVLLPARWPLSCLEWAKLVAQKNRLFPGLPTLWVPSCSS
jgi:hypothetical protein